MAGLGSAPSDRARAGGANEHAVVPAPLCTEARRTVAIGTALMTSAGPTLLMALPGVFGPTAVLSDDGVVLLALGPARASRVRCPSNGRS